MLLLQFYPSMAGLQLPVLQKVFAFQVHTGEFVQIVHVGNNHWCDCSDSESKCLHRLSIHAPRELLCVLLLCKH